MHCGIIENEIGVAFKNAFKNPMEYAPSENGIHHVNIHDSNNLSEIEFEKFYGKYFNTPALTDYFFRTETSQPNSSQKLISETQSLVKALTREERQNLNAAEVPNLEFISISGQEFLENPAFLELKKEVLKAIEIGYQNVCKKGGKFMAEKFSKQLEHLQIKLCTCGGKLIASHTIEAVSKGVLDIDWVVLNPRNPIRGLSGTSVFASSVEKLAENNDLILGTRPWNNIFFSSLNRCGLVAYDITKPDAEGYEDPQYVRFRKLLNEDSYASQSPQNVWQIQQALQEWPAEENALNINLCDSVGSHNIRGVRFHVDQSNIESMNDCNLYKTLSTLGESNSEVMTKVFREKKNTLLCLFEKSKLSSNDYQQFKKEVFGGMQRV